MENEMVILPPFMEQEDDEEKENRKTELELEEEKATLVRLLS